MRKTGKNKGITLIALVITIIVMLILVAVTINITVNGGLFGYAGNAASQTKIAKEEEQNLGNLASGLTVNELIEKATFQEIHDWKKNGDTLTCTCKECKKINAQGRTLTIGDELAYIDKGAASSILSAEKSGLAKRAVDNSDSSLAVDQTIYKDLDTKWVVLGVKDSNNNGTNETLLLTTEKPTESLVQLYGAAAYNYWELEANRIAKELYGNDARGITIQDVYSCVGKNLTFDNKTVSESRYWDLVKQSGTKNPNPDEEDTEENLGKYIVTYKYFKLNNNTKAEEVLLNGLPSDTSKGYLIATCSVGVSYMSTNKAVVNFGPAWIINGGFVTPGVLFVSDGTSKLNAYNMGFRALVELTSSIPEKVTD